jgi:GT2 family glycosyltransferase
VIATKIVDYCDEVQTLFVPFPTSTIKKNPGVLDKSSKVSYYLGGAHAIRKSVFLKLGGYSKELYFGEEELDFSYKAIQAGFDLLYLPEVLIHHFSESSVTTGGKAREIHCHLANRFLIAKKYLPYRYWPSYLTSWSGKYLLDSLKICRPSSYSKGLIHGLSHMRRLERNPLGEEAISYLKKNYGRLYF